MLQLLRSLAALDAYRPIGRLFGNLYATQRDRFALPRESHAQWLARVKAGHVKADHVKAGDVTGEPSGENQ